MSKMKEGKTLRAHFESDAKQSNSEMQEFA